MLLNRSRKLYVVFSWTLTRTEQIAFDSAKIQRIYRNSFEIARREGSIRLAG